MMRALPMRAALAIGTSFVIAFASARLHAQDDRQIIRVTGDLYRLQDGPRATVFLVTPSGILLADPLDEPAARWLKTELATRYPDHLVRFVVQSYPTLDRASGGLVFQPEAEVVGHADFNRAISREAKQWPPSAAVLDRNHNKRLEPDELTTAPNRAELLTHDVNHDGDVSLAELYAQIAHVKTSFIGRQVLTLGGKRIEIVNPGKLYAAGTTAILFPDERVLFSPESSIVTAAPFSFAGRNARALQAWAHAIAALPFDTLMSGRGETIARADFEALVAYVDDLITSVVDAYKAGIPLADIQARPVPDKFRASPHEAGRRAQIAAVHDTLTVVDTGIQAAAIGSWFSSNRNYCASSFDTCASGGSVLGGALGLHVTMGRLGAVLELSSGGQFTSHRETVLYDDAFAHRAARGSLLLRRGSKRPGNGSMDLLAGVSLSAGNSKGLARVKEGFAPFAGRQVLDVRPIGFGLTVGADLVKPTGNRRSLVMPLRVTFTPAVSDDFSPGRFDVQAGIGFRFGVNQRFK